MKTYLNDPQAISSTIKFSKFNFLRSKYVWCVKNQTILATKLGIFRIQQELSKSKSNLIRFIRSNKKYKSLLKKIVQVAYCQLFKTICMESKYITPSV